MVLQEFAIAKICSVFGVGPRVLSPYGFDVICYRNCIEFCMERCLPWCVRYHHQDKVNIEKRLKHCMKVMHLLRLVHRDIKPSNIVFSPSVDDYVFCDFGISHPIAEETGFKTKTAQSGTHSFMSHEMALISQVTPGEADLYYNDMHCLQISLKMMELQYSVPLPKLATTPEAINPLCRVFSTIYRIFTDQPIPDIDQQLSFYTRQFAGYFPQLKSLLPSGMYMDQFHAYSDIDFVASSLPIDMNIYRYLSLCNPKDPRIDMVLKRIYRR